MMPLSRALVALLFVLLVACGKSDQGVAPPTPVEAPAVAPPAPPPPTAVDGPAQGSKPLPAPITGAPTGFGTPEEQYAACKTRVEGADAAGECTSDADCVRGGCSQELCVSTAQAAEGMMSTCEIRPCFQILESCGCHDGVCSWQVGG